MSATSKSIPIPTNMAFHDLTPEKTAPLDARSLLGLGSKFISTPSKTTGSLNHSFERFERDFIIRVIFACETDITRPT